MNRTRLITIDLEEYNKLKEHQFKTSEEIRKQAIELHNKWIKEYEENQRHLRLCEQHDRVQDENRFRQFIRDNSNIFGYIKRDKIIHYIINGGKDE